MKLALVGLLAFGFVTPALAQSAPGTVVSPVQVDKPEEPKPLVGVKPGALDDPDRIVCKREHVVGSNRPQKVCMTVAQRQLLKDKAELMSDPGRRTAGTKEDFGYERPQK